MPELTDDERRAMRRNGLPWREKRADRIRFSPVPYLSVALLIGYALCLVWMYRTLVPDRELENGVIPGLGTEAIVKANSYAIITAVVMSLVLILADRFRTQSFLPRLGVWLLTFGWGACAATGFSLWLNTWMGQHLGIMGEGDPATGARAAVFVAPFVEEFAKATVVFWIAILARYRWVSPLGGISLAGLSAIGFAYTENIIYYARIYRAAAQAPGITPEDAMTQLFVIRGIASCFAHPLFTVMTVFGLVLAVRTRSRMVRVIAPVAGFLGAALLHMAWNGFSSTLPNPYPLYWLLALPMFFFVVMFTIRQVRKQSRLVHARLGDYVLAGWFADEDRTVISSPVRRLGLVWASIHQHPVTAFLGPLVLVVSPPLLIGVWVFDWKPAVEFLIVALSVVMAAVVLVMPSPWRRTLRWINLGTELAYLRDAMTRGLVDEAGRSREGEIFAELEQLRADGVEPRPRRVTYAWTWVREAVNDWRSRRRPATTGQHSAVDPSWAPPPPRN